MVTTTLVARVPLAAHALPVALLWLAVTVVFGPAARHRFVHYDDFSHVVESPVLNPPSVAGLWHAWSRPLHGIYAPVTHTLWWCLARFHRAEQSGTVAQTLDPRVFHVANVVLHALVATACYALLYRLLAAVPGAGLAAHRRRAAGGGALATALHPLTVESVAWCAETKGLCSTWWSLVALWMYVDWVQQSEGDTFTARDEITSRRLAARGWRSAVYIAATLAFALAMLSKPTAIVTPVWAGLLHLAWLGGSWRRAAWALAPWCLFAMLLAGLTQSSQADAVAASWAPSWQRPLVAGDALAWYARQWAWPIKLGPDYGRTPQVVLAAPLSAAGALAAVVVLWVALWAWRGARRWALAATVLFLAPAPVWGLVPFYFQEYSTVADRYLYAGLWGGGLAVALWLSGTGNWARFVVAMVLVTWGTWSAKQVARWHDDEALAQAAVRCNPASVLGAGLLARGYVARGEPLLALAVVERNAEQNPGVPLAWFQRGHIELLAGRTAAAVKSFRRAVALNANSVGARQALAEAEKQAAGR